MEHHERVTAHIPEALADFGHLAIAENRLDQARARCEQTRALAREADTRPVLGAFINLAHVAKLEGRRQDAAELAQEAVARSLAAGYRPVAAAAAVELPWAVGERIESRRTARLLGAALEVFRFTGLRSSERTRSSSRPPETCLSLMDSTWRRCKG